MSKKEKIFYYKKKKKPYLQLKEDSLPIIRHSLSGDVCVRVEKLGSGQMEMVDGDLVRFEDLRVYLKEEKVEEGMKCICEWGDGEVESTRVIVKENPACPFSSHREGTTAIGSESCLTQ